MDKGLDITLHALALHAALYLRPGTLGPALPVLRTAAARGEPAVRRTVSDLAARFRITPDETQAARTVDWLRRNPACGLLLLGDPDYPPALAAIADPPPLLFLRGRRALLCAPQLAVVGSRAATPTGLDIAGELATALCHAGFVVTSGLARGIDGAAHRGALAAGGDTIAVLGCGIDAVYPAQHQRLAGQIAGAGLLISELPLGAAPLPHHFPRRNRIISGMAAGLLVVEAGLASGSLLTARSALEQGREVFAVPGTVRNPQARGCHALIREGATLVESVDDVLAALPRHVLQAVAEARASSSRMDAATARSARQGTTVTASEPADEAERQVLEALGYEPVAGSLLVMRTGLTMHTLSSILLTLELSGRVRALPGGAFERVR